MATFLGGSHGAILLLLARYKFLQQNTKMKWSRGKWHALKFQAIFENIIIFFDF